MLSSSFAASLTTTTTFSSKIVTSPAGHVRSQPILAFATATGQRPSYLSHNGMASNTTSFYQILGITAGASEKEIKTAYWRLARVCHPDVAAVDRKDSSANEFMKIHAAYSTLSDPEKRASYDRSLLHRRRPLTMTAARFSGYGGRKWETDQCW